MGSSTSCISSSSVRTTRSSSSLFSSSSTSSSSFVSSTSSSSLTLQYVMLYTLLGNDLSKLITSYIPRCIYRFCGFDSEIGKHTLVESVTMLDVDNIIRYCPIPVHNTGTAVSGLPDDIYCLKSSSEDEPSELIGIGKIKPILTPRIQASVTLIDNRFIFVTGGNSGNFGGATLSAVECFDIISGTWSSKAPMTQAREHHCTTVSTEYAAASSSSKLLFAFGGWCYQKPNALLKLHLLNTCEVYNVSTNTWSVVPPMRWSRSQATAVSYGNRIYVFGGVIAEEGCYPSWKAVTSCECFDIPSSKWMESDFIPDMPSARFASQAVVFNVIHATSVNDNNDNKIENTFIAIIGGYESSQPVDTALLYNISSNT